MHLVLRVQREINTHLEEHAMHFTLFRTRVVVHFSLLWLK